MANGPVRVENADVLNAQATLQDRAEVFANTMRRYADYTIGNTGAGGQADTALVDTAGRVSESTQRFHGKITPNMEAMGSLVSNSDNVSSEGAAQFGTIDANI